MAAQYDIAEMAKNVVADESTLALLVDLRKLGQTGIDAAKLIEWFIDTRADFVEALKQSREESAHYLQSADDLAALLCRVNDHLGTLATFAMGRISDDPWPEPAPAKPARKRRTKA